MNASIPPRFSFSPLSPARLLLALGTGVAPTLLILASGLPLWLRAWLWVPVLSLSVAAIFGRVEGRPLTGLLHSALLFTRRRRRRVWAARRSGDEAGNVVASVPRRAPAWIGKAAQGARRLGEAAAFYGIASGIAITIAVVLGLALRWAITRAGAPPDALRPVQASEVQQLPPANFSLPAATPLPSPTPTPTPTAVPTPVQAPVVWTAEESSWDVVASPGYLALDNSEAISCGVELVAPGWDYSVVIPPAEVTKVLVVPLLQPQAAWERLAVRSWCNLDVELVAFQPCRPQYSRLWLVPVCDPPGRVRIRPHESAASVTILNPEGVALDAAIEAPIAGEWAPEAPAAGCWLYKVESAEPVWLDVMVFDWP